jgi:segregation and condensation protein A
MLPRLERDVHQAGAEMNDRPTVIRLPELTLREMLLAFGEVLRRAEMYAHLHMRREPLSVRERMSKVLATLADGGFHEFQEFFDLQEGRMGVTVTFLALLELLKEALIELVQADCYSPIHVRAATARAGYPLEA